MEIWQKALLIIIFVGVITPIFAALVAREVSGYVAEYKGTDNYLPDAVADLKASIKKAAIDDFNRVRRFFRSESL